MSVKKIEENNNRLVYDFLYHDARRVGSFLGQFDDNGLLTSLTQGETTNKDARRGYRIGVGANIPVFGGGNLDIERNSHDVGSENLERAYDPFWSNALVLLETLLNRKLVQNKIEKASIGQFVLIKGALIIADLQMLRSFWPLSSIQTLINQAAGQGSPQMGNRKERRANKASAGQIDKNSAANPIQMMMEMLPHMPHTGQAYLLSDTAAAWASISQESLVVPLPDLVLKHGTKIAGEWSMLGILDARPDKADSGLSPKEELQLQSISSGPNVASSMVPALGPLVRKLLGRPEHLYGITPLMIFREIQS